MLKAGVRNTNNGNMSRNFYSDTNKASQITGVDVTLINRFKVILETISSGYNTDTKKLQRMLRKRPNFMLTYMAGILCHRHFTKS